MQAERIRFSGFAPNSPIVAISPNPEVHLYGKIFSRNSSAPISRVPHSRGPNSRGFTVHIHTSNGSGSFFLEEAVALSLMNQRVFRDRRNPLDSFNDIVFISCYRITRVIFYNYMIKVWSLFIGVL